MSETPQDTSTTTVDSAIANAARILRNAEMETNLALMERLERIADSWVAIAGLLAQRERDT